MWLSQNCKKVIGLFEMWIRDKDVKDKIVEREEVIGIDRAVINGIIDQDITGAIKSLTIEKIWFLSIKKSSKDLSNNKS